MITTHSSAAALAVAFVESAQRMQAHRSQRRRYATAAGSEFLLEIQPPGLACPATFPHDDAFVTFLLFKSQSRRCPFLELSRPHRLACGCGTPPNSTRTDGFTAEIQLSVLGLRVMPQQGAHSQIDRVCSRRTRRCSQQALETSRPV